MDCSATRFRKGRSSDIARNDCHTCSAKQRKCDRTRPHCRKCRQSEQECEGFPVQLSWQPGFSTSKKPTKRSIVRRPKRKSLQYSLDTPHFEFISEYPSKHQTHVSSALDKSSPPPGTAQESDLQLSWISPKTLQIADGLDQRPELRMITLSGEREIEFDASDDAIGLLEDISSLSFATESSGLDACSVHELFDRFCYTIPPAILYDGCFQRFEPIFRRYNHEFSIIPLTLNLPMNPFRCLTQVLKQSTHLQHAVLALACHHIENARENDAALEVSKPIFDHGQTALHLLRETLASYDIARMSSSLIDTIMTLFSLDEAYSLLGNWTAHLSGAYSILEISGGVEALIKNPRTVVQVALLVWWDAVLSLVNRTRCIFPYKYLEAVLACRDDRLWTFFGLCGCPQGLVVLLVQTAHLAAEKQECPKAFDNGLILDIEKSLEAWTYMSSESENQDEESMHHDMDCMHCSEAWRNGLLLYIYRVFWWNPGETPPLDIANRARVTLDHVCSCRDDQYLARQALLPLFFAGCEMADAFAQSKIRALCTVWNKRTRYHMFAGMIPLLDEVWTAKATSGAANVWWGQIVDNTCVAASQHSLQTRICFG